MLPFPKDIFATSLKTKKQFNADKDIFYKYINFKDVLSYYFPEHNLAVFIDQVDIQKRLTLKYGNARDCFMQRGVLKTINFTTLSFYQEDTGIDGPQYHDVEDPVSIINYNHSLLLWEGYHRALMKIVNNEITIRGFVLEI